MVTELRETYIKNLQSGKKELGLWATQTSHITSLSQQASDLLNSMEDSSTKFSTLSKLITMSTDNLPQLKALTVTLDTQKKAADELLKQIKVLYENPPSAEKKAENISATTSSKKSRRKKAKKSSRVVKFDEETKSTTDIKSKAEEIKASESQIIAKLVEEVKAHELRVITTLLDKAKQTQEEVANALKLFDENSKKLNSYSENYIVDGITNKTFKGYAHDAYLAYQKENTQFQQSFTNSNDATAKSVEEACEKYTELHKQILKSNEKIEQHLEEYEKQSKKEAKETEVNQLLTEVKSALDVLEKTINTKELREQEFIFGKFKAHFQFQRPLQPEFNKLFAGNFNTFEEFTPAQFQLYQITVSIKEATKLYEQLNNNKANITPEQMAKLKTQQENLTENLSKAKEIITKNRAFVTQLKNSTNQLETDIATLKKENETLETEKNSISAKLQTNKEILAWYNKYPKLLAENQSTSIIGIKSKFTTLETENQTTWEKFVIYFNLPNWLSSPSAEMATAKKTFNDSCNYLSYLNLKNISPKESN